MKKYLGLEFGSTRIKAVIIDERANVLSVSSYTWKDQVVDTYFSYSEKEIQKGMAECLNGLEGLNEIDGAGISAMMHGYIALDKDGNLLVPFRTWRNENTREAASKLSELFKVNIPLRWSIAHLYQCILDNEPHVKDIAYITTLAGYVHYKLTGEKVLGIGDASGMFPIDVATGEYDKKMLEKFDKLIEDKHYPWKIEEILPKILKAGQNAGEITENGEKYTNKLLKKGLKLCPPEGDAGTGMVATNSVKPKTGNVSAGTSAFTMMVLSKPLNNVHPEVDIVTTPDGREVAMVHANECTQGLNSWVELLKGKITYPDEDIYSYLFHLTQSADYDNPITYSLLKNNEAHIDDETGEVTIGEYTIDMVNFMQSLIYGCVAPLALGMKAIEGEKIKIKRFTGHGGFFKTPEVSAPIMSAALNAPIALLSTASEGGPWGMAILASMLDADESLPDYLDMIFKDLSEDVYKASKYDKITFNRFLH